MKTKNTLAFLTITLLLLSGLTTNFAQSIWTGNTNTNWSTVSNWSPALIPAEDEDILILAGCSNYPVINNTQIIKSLTIDPNAIITQNGGLIRVDGGETSISGSLNQIGGILETDDLTVNTGGLLSIGITTSSGPTLDVSGNFKNYSTVILNCGDVTLRGSVENFVDGDLSIEGATIISLGHDVKNKASMSISSGGLFLKKADGSNIDKKIEIDGGIFTQTGGTVSSKDMELKNSGTYNQSDGELQISHDLKVNEGTTFNSTGGTVHFTGNAGGGSYFKGNVKFHNVFINDGADPKFDNNGDDVTIKISGNFTNNNANMNEIEDATFIFNITGDQTIYSAVIPTPDDYEETTFGTLIIDKPSGALTLLSDIAVDDVFTPTQGYLDLNGNTLFVDGSEYTGPLPVELSAFSAVTLENGVKLC
ncbi:MAG: hypothetical protein KJN64_04525 [Ignavibacteria bacterium]|nr:hypothetical protein [Ignavibacteria bacterium]MBT8383660.1 hypothetical protein [Ignavibacteria bacterium]MBT8391369.1 hypothetical protein [Ignavibacteria bacterium]NNJ52925.1 hypothetical protein [Ignavibacteriaceae bacterium]NNL21498.1 hypothetical protein [Ignavibacteriaceae bacterium]